MTNKPISRKANIVVQDLENEVLIYDLTINKAYCLNQTAGLVYQLCNGKRTVAEISELMSKEIKTKVSEDLVWLALDGLKKDDLLENADQLPNHFGELTRREVVKRVGLTSMIMLPIISSVIAPNALMAQSGAPIALLGACPSGSGCQSGLNCVNCAALCPSSGPTCCSGSASGPKFGGGITLTATQTYPDCPTCLTGVANSVCCSGTGTLQNCVDTSVPGTPSVSCRVTCS